ncbi:hypothetical protein HZ992_15835 [Rhizobacter sp. AJA081-3]|jgi:hypothetical protein|uniref:hypothetical protein n=1 Tax=Rhizobacter sp. AJA081-3 TaxID=2753607 RepID=UPI001ADFF3C5|nr:hypothetical protein [Rhizobacter sp. AJA081-3]QTN21644.1 hypothetical protein HZ992_15835 [Rhizobacter sp. AJA081-3]
MQAFYAADFKREMGCTEAELLMWLPGAVNGRALTLLPRSAEIAIDGGRLELAWRELPPRRIALLRMPRLAIAFHFEGVGEAPRQAFMRYFDLYTQRGGG